MRADRRQAFAFSAFCIAMMAGCASHPQKVQPPKPATSAAPQPTPSAPLMPSAGTAPSEQLPPAPDGMVGVALCDQYLSTYKACHRAAGIFAPGQLDARYQLMRDTLLRDARDPVKRAALDERCRALSRQLEQALHGKSCYPAPASGASSG